ncbi:hypothetical protein CM49_00825 [Paenibacillus sp. P1XP2]|nr:hypothetical protein CM49_00825 [Paenibacillus sp. P1XP2]
MPGPSDEWVFATPKGGWIAIIDALKNIITQVLMAGSFAFCFR